MENIEAQLGTPPEGLIGPELPLGCEMVWEWFCELSNSRSFNMSGPNPISDLDIYAWSVNTGHRLRLWELVAIRRLDTLYRKSVDEDGDEFEEVPDG